MFLNIKKKNNKKLLILFFYNLIFLDLNKIIKKKINNFLIKNHRKNHKKKKYLNKLLKYNLNNNFSKKIILYLQIPKKCPNQNQKSPNF